MIADVIGRESALVLVAQLPRAYSKGHPAGQPILYVPKSLPPSHPLVTLLTFPVAHKLARAFGGEIMYPAICAELDRADRDQDVARLIGEGKSIAEIAAQLRMTDRHTRRIVERIKTDKAPEEKSATAADNRPN